MRIRTADNNQQRENVPKKYSWVRFVSKKSVHTHSKPSHTSKNSIQAFEFKNFAGNENCMDLAWKRDSSSDCVVSERVQVLHCCVSSGA
jgi:hypothetical protein